MTAISAPGAALPVPSARAHPGAPALRALAASWFGPYSILATALLLGLLLLSISRAGLIAWQFERVAAAGPVAPLLLQGVRADLILLGLWLLPPVLLAPLWGRQRFFRSWLGFCHLWCLLGLMLIVFVELSTPQFILQYDIRPNRLYIEYLKYPQEVLHTLWRGYRIAVVVGISATVALILLLARLLKPARAASRPYPDLLLWLTWPLVFLLATIAIRSTTGHRPANPATFALTGDALVNSLVISSPYSVLYALYSMAHESRSSEIYGKLPDEEMLSLARDWPWLKQASFDNKDYPTLHNLQATAKRDKPLNLVIVLEESLGATFVQSLGGAPVTPELEKLKQQGWWFEQMYATGTRSVRGIEAVVAGFPPTPAQSVLKLSLAQQNFYTLGSALGAHGYHTSFIYGGEAHFDNMRGFLTANGFKQVIDQGQIPDPVFVGSWGASDEDLFAAAHRHLQERHARGEPFFSFVFTSSNHEPFEFPDGRITLHEQPKNTANNAVKYADHALGQFIRQAQASDYWKDTLFLIVADHDNRVYGSNLVPVEKFHIPALILGADIAPRRIEPVASQIDLAPTLLSLMGVSGPTPMLGRDFSRDADSPGRALMQFEQYFALMEQDRLTILRPQSAALAARYDPVKRLVIPQKEAPAEQQVRRAMAQVLLPSMLYREQRYRADGA